MFIHANHRIVCSVVTQMCDFATLLTRFTEMAKRLMKFDHIDLLQSRNMSHYRGKASLGIITSLHSPPFGMSSVESTSGRMQSPNGQKRGPEAAFLCNHSLATDHTGVA